MSKVAGRLAKCFEYNGARTVFTVLKGEDHKALSNLMHSLDVDEDTVYEEVSFALDSIAEEGVEHLEDNFYYYCEADVYTHDLLKWVGASLHNVAWCDEALGQADSDSFVDIIMFGQALAKEHIWRAVIDLVREMERE